MNLFQNRNFYKYDKYKTVIVKFTVIYVTIFTIKRIIKK